MNTFIDLFCGVGGFHHALKNSGLECVFSSDIDRRAAAVYSENFNHEVFGDITQIHENEIPEHDVLCAGFPCQPFSLNGKMIGLKDERNLFAEIVRIADYCRPSVLFLENVRNILKIDNGKMYQLIVSMLDDIGYKVNYSILNSSLFGVPHNRERVYFICIRKDLGWTYQEPFPTYEQIYMNNIIEDDVDQHLYYDEKLIWYVEPMDQPYCLKPIKIGHYKTTVQEYRVFHLNGHSVTQLKGGFGGLYKVKDGVRMLNLKERYRLMGFPSDFKMVDDRYSYGLLGNSVVVPVIEKVFQGIQSQ